MGFFVWTINFKGLFVFTCLFSWLTVHNSRPDIFTGKVFPTAVGIKFFCLMLLHCYQSFNIIFFIVLGKVNPHFSFWVPGISVASISTTVLLFLKQFIYIFRPNDVSINKNGAINRWSIAFIYSLNSIIIIIIIITMVIIIIIFFRNGNFTLLKTIKYLTI